MPVYVTMYKFTEQGIRNVKDSPQRLKAGIQAAEAIGAKVLGAYYTVGEYDLLVISEVEKEEIGVAQVLAQCSQGNVRSTTMRAFTPDEFAEIVKKIP